MQNPRTGEILALANRPTFNPNVFNSVHDKEALKNRAVSDVYEPGSVFKTVTYSAAIEQHVVKPEDKVDCQDGSINVFGMTIHDAHKMGVMTIAEAYAHSSDVAAIKTGMKLGDVRFDDYIRDYGFGAQTGIELPGETRGLKKPVNRWSKVSIGAMSMGQEIGVTAVQIISMVSTIANDGVYTPPRIVAGELPPNAGPKPVVFHPPQQHRVISTMTAAQMKKMMEGVVLDGTARRAILDGYTVAGKTGTAQKVDPNDRRVLQDQVRGVVCRLCAGQHPGRHHRGDPRFGTGTAPGRPGFRAGVPAHRSAGAGVPARSPRHRAQESAALHAPGFPAQR